METEWKPSEKKKNWKKLKMERENIYVTLNQGKARETD